MRSRVRFLAVREHFSQGIKSSNLDLVSAHFAMHDSSLLRTSILDGRNGLISGDFAVDKMDFALLAAAILEHAGSRIFVGSRWA